MNNTTKKIKVLHIITYLPVGGAQDNTLITVEDLDKARYDVTLLCARKGEWVDRALAVRNLKIIFIDELLRKIHPVYDLVAFFRIFRLIRIEKYDIVHTHSSKPGFSGRLAAKMAGVPIVVHTIHGFPFHEFMNPVASKFFILLERLLSKFSDKLITVSKLNMKKAISLKLAGKDKFVNIYSGIRYNKFQGPFNTIKIKQSLHISSSLKIVGMIGRLSEQKAPQFFIQSIPEVLKQHKKTHFILVGDGELRKPLEKLCRRLKIEDCVHFLGYRDDIPELLSIMDVFVLPSLWEGLGRSLTEALYMKRPVIASDVEGVPELIEHGKTGLLVKPKDKNSISSAILYLLKNPDIAIKLGNQGRRRVIDNFEAKKMVHEIDLLYQKLLKKL